LGIFKGKKKKKKKKPNPPIPVLSKTLKVSAIFMKEGINE
jgi:hypothetical protein